MTFRSVLAINLGGRLSSSPDQCEDLREYDWIGSVFDRESISLNTKKKMKKHEESGPILLQGRWDSRHSIFSGKVLEIKIY